MLKVTLKKSTIGEVPKNRATVKALGLGKTGRSVLQHDTPSIRGMIHQVKHLLAVEVVDDQEKARKRRDPKAAAEAAAKPVKKTAAKAAMPEAKAETPAEAPKKPRAKKAATEEA